jgi:N-acetylmuramic acid 6-phosphate etherase
MVVGLIAGGSSAFLKAVEGAEDNTTLCREDLKGLNLNSKDTVIGLAASGRTPYVIHGLKYASSIGCSTVAIACTKESEIGKEAEIAIEPVTGPEILTGSTRLKAGTAQKMILNMISTGSMVGIGKVYQNLMVDVQQTNEKLKLRAQNSVMEATGCTKDRAKELLDSSKGEVKAAIIMQLLDIDYENAKNKLNGSGGMLKGALNHSH